jgi:flagellar basal body P-ring protein FlgI
MCSNVQLKREYAYGGVATEAVGRRKKVETLSSARVRNGMVIERKKEHSFGTDGFSSSAS